MKDVDRLHAEYLAVVRAALKAELAGRTSRAKHLWRLADAEFEAWSHAREAAWLADVAELTAKEVA